MKKFIIFLFAAVSLIGCSKGLDETDSGLAGEWKLVSWSAETPEAFGVYMDFRADGSFVMYQKVETSVFVSYSGTYTTADGVVKGVYSDGIPWGTSYQYNISSDGSKLTMYSETALREVSVYARTTIPAEVRQAKPEVRSASGAGDYRFL